jgi:exodeoxyribonuclease V beta subunit
VTDTFDVCGDLPTGTTVLEASAGTGKTFTIAALATRYVAEGRAELRDLMLVTFGRAATQELRERVRERLVATERILADPVAARASTDSLEVSLASAAGEEVALRRKRLTAALADFDAATITTTHGFCQQMLTRLGVEGDLEPEATFVESIDDLVVEVVDDLYLRKFGRPNSDPPLMTYADALSTVRRAIYDPQADLEPEDAEPDSLAGLRFGIARAARTEVARRKRQRRLLDYDDLVIRLRDALVASPDAQERVRSRFTIVMVDEFQDTDPAQWKILELAFHTFTTLVLIGDPKQAIYAFRGGDVEAYLAASSVATARSTLGTNWRSDSGLLDALGAVFGGAALGDEQIVVQPVDSAHPDRRLKGAPSDAPLRLRVVRRDLLGTAPTKIPKVGAARALVATDVATDVVRLLEAGATLATEAEPRTLAPGDVAVLVRTNAQAMLVRDAFREVGVPAVLTGAVNVFTTDMAGEWLVLLQALEQPHRAVRVRTAAIGCFVGWSAEQLAAAGDDAMDELGPLLRSWAEVLATRGVPALLELVTERGLPGQLLRTVDGERQLTDLRHLAQSLHAASVDEELGVAALVEWLQRRIADAGTDPTEERSRRLESDADAVQVVTVHRSKGLEFPVVYVPFGWDTHKQTPDLLRVHRPGRRVLDVGGRDGPRYAEHKDMHEAEEAGEDLRLLYVALTRAQCQVVTWWVPSTNTPCSPLQRLLMAPFNPGEEPAAKVPVPHDDAAAAAFAALAERAAGTIAVETVESPEGHRWAPEIPELPELSAAPFDRGLDTAWRRLSYTGLTSAAYHGGAGVSSEPEEPQLDDEVDEAPFAQADLLAEPLRDVISPMAGLPAGAAFGIAVHTVLETVDTTASDLLGELTDRCRDVLESRLTRTMDPVELATALLPSLETPLGPLAGELRLCDIAPADRLAELDFELPLAGGDSLASSAATLKAIARLLRKKLPARDPLAAYPDRLEELDDQRLRGYLVGSLDAVLRLRDADGEPTYVVADYKTNWLGGVSAEPLSAWHYRPEALTEAMLEAHYPLQALLYCVALHRYLRWRQPGYDPDRHLGGVLYLFVRGMSGPDTPRLDGVPCGVFGWRPPKGLVEALSRLLAGAGR